MLGRIRDLVATGRYSEALEFVRMARGVPAEQQPFKETLWAELAQYTGSDEEAISHAEAVLASKPSNHSLVARCHVAIAEVHRNAGRADLAMERCAEAIDEAGKGNDAKQAALAELRMLLAMADGLGPDAAAAYVPKARRYVTRAGDPFITCALHLYLAQVEAQRGVIDNSREHLRIGRSLLGADQHPYYQGVAAIDASCLAFSTSDLDITEAEARSALRDAARSGHAALRRAAITNLAHVELARGRFARAQSLFVCAVSLSPPDGMVQAGITDGLAQLAMARGDLSEAERILSAARPWTPDSPKGSWYYGLWTSVTRARLLLRQHRSDQAAAQLTDALGAARELADPLLASVLAQLLVEAHARRDRPADAARVLAESGIGAWSSTVDMMAGYGRALGLALAAGGADDMSRVWFERGAQTVAAVGNNAALAVLADACADALVQRLRLPGPRARPQTPIDALDPMAGEIVRRLDRAAPLVPRQANRAAVALERAAALVESGAYPMVTANEVMEVLLESDCVPRAVLTVSREGRPTELLSWFGCSWSAAEALAAEPPRRIEVGEWQGRRFVVAAAMPPDAARLAALIAIERLVAASQFERRARIAERERVALWPIDERDPPDDFVYCSSEMTTLVASARKVAGMSITVLVTGETGTGKEMLARVIHATSPRCEKPFAAFNCTAVPKELADSQLFGHAVGAFTGAATDQPGVIRAAAGGTLYLDEIGDLGLDVQPKLLRFLESGEIQPLGESRAQKVNVRVIASTNRSLDRLVAEGLFRSDLFYRLNVVPFHVPPLRERREEVPPLAEHFLNRAAREYGKGDLRLSEQTMEYLVLYRWPGNVRQLANEMRRMAAMAEAGAVLMPEHLDPLITAGRRTVPVDASALPPNEVTVRLDQPHAALMEHAERAQIRYAMTQCEGRVEQAAKMLGLSRKGLYLKRQRLGIE